jgi:hypothetical protein
MNTAQSGQEIDDTEAQYLQDIVLDKPGQARRRGPIQSLASFAKLPRQASGLAITIDPAGSDRYAAMTGTVSNGYLSVWSADKTTITDIAWPHALPTDPASGISTAFRLVSAMPAAGGGTWIGTASDYGADDAVQALGFWRGGTKADYATGTIAFTRGSAAVTGSGTTWTTNVSPGMFLFANTDDASAGTFTSTLIGVVLTVNSNTSITLMSVSPYSGSAGRAYNLTSLRGFMPRVAKGKITTATDSAVVSGGGTKFQAQSLATGVWNIYRASDFTWIGKVTSVQSDISLTLAANAAIATADEGFIAIRGDWTADDKSVDIGLSTNKTGWLTGIYAERQWYLNNSASFNKTYQLWYADPSDPEAVDLSLDGDWIPISSTSDIPEPARALVPTYNAMLVIKESETFAVYGTSPSSFSAKKLEDDGTLSTMSVQSFGGGAIWAGRNGIYYYDGVQVRNITDAKLGDVWKNSVRSVDPLRYRMWSMLVRNHYVLFVEDLDPTISVVKGNTISTPTHWVVAVNMQTLQPTITLGTNIRLRGAVNLPASAGRGVAFLVNNNRNTPTGLAAVGSGTGGTLPADTYYYTVSAVDSVGETLESSEVSYVATGSTSSVALTWTAVPGAHSYKVWRSDTTSGDQDEFKSVTTNSYTDTAIAGWTAGSPLGTATVSKGVVCDGNQLFDAEGRDEIGCDGAERGPDFYFNSKKYNAGNDVQLKRFKQLAIHYLAQGGAIKVDTVLGLNEVGQTLSGDFPATVITWDQLRVLLPNWSSVGDQYPAWDNLIEGVFRPKRVRFLKKDHHMSFRLWQEVNTMTRVKVGPFHIAYKLMRPQRVT